MENNSNAIAEIQKSMPDAICLCRPQRKFSSILFTRLRYGSDCRSFLKILEIFLRSASVKTGNEHNRAKDIWEETYSPAKPLLMKIAAADWHTV